MDSRLREQLLGYLLGALDQDEIEVVEDLLLHRPELHLELDHLRELLDPLDEVPADEATPLHLAERTCNLVEFHAVRESDPGHSSLDPLISNNPPPASVVGPRQVVVMGDTQSSWTALDMFVAIGVCLSLSVLFLPALAASRDQARTLQCQNQLAHLGIALHTYFDNFGSFPAIPQDGEHNFAGIFASKLRECELLEDESQLICPSSPLAESLGEWRGVFVVDGHDTSGLSSSAFRSDALSSGTASYEAVRQSGGSYAYCLGIVVQGQYQMPDYESRPTFALLGDGSWASGGNRIGHGKCGQNLLYKDGQVQWVKTVGFETAPDHPYRNLRGQVSAGLSVDDSVLGDSAVPPFSTPMPPKR